MPGRVVDFCCEVVDAITTQIYSQLYLGKVPHEIHAIEKQTSYDLYFLLDVDTPWIADPLRDQGHRRKEIMEIFRQELERRKIDYILISGNYREREEKVKSKIEGMFDVKRLLRAP